MFVKSLSVKGFLGIKEYMGFNFGDSSVFVGKTGSGKTSAIAAIRWALFGTTRVKKNVNSVLHSDSDKASVTVWMEIGGKDYKIVRERPAGGSATLKVYACMSGKYKSIGGSNVTTAQRKINSLLGVDPTLLESVIFSGRESYVLAKPEERRKLLLSLLPDTAGWDSDFAKVSDRYKEELGKLESLERAVEDAKLDLEDIDQEAREAREVIDSNASAEELDKRIREARGSSNPDNIAALETKLSMLRAEREGRERERQEELRSIYNNVQLHDSLLSDYVDAEWERTDAADAVEDARRRIKQEEEVCEEGSSSESEVRARLEQLTGEYHHCREASLDLRDAAETLRESGGNTCPTCGVDLGEDGVRRALDSVTSAMQDKERQLDVLGDKIDKARVELDSVIASSNSATQAIQQAQREEASAISRLDAANSTIADIVVKLQGYIGKPLVGDELVGAVEERLAQDVSVMDEARKRPAEQPGEEELYLEGLINNGSSNDEVTRLEELLYEVRKANDACKNLVEERKDIEAQLMRVQSRLDEVSKLVKELEVLKDACSTKGIQTWLMSSVLKTIAERQNDLLRVAGFGHITVRYVDRKFTRTGKSNPTLDIMVAVNGHERPVEALSGGERALVTLTASVALYGVINADSAERGVLVCDETLSGLDDSAAQMVCSLIAKLPSVSSVGQVFIVTHDHAAVRELVSSGSELFEFICS